MMHTQQSLNAHIHAGLTRWTMWMARALRQVALTLEGGRQLRAYPKADMSWQLSGVPAGQHLLEATALGYTMPSVGCLSCTSSCCAMLQTVWRHMDL